MGRFGGAFGIKGWVRVQSFTETPENIFSYLPWLILEQEQWVEVKVKQHKAHKSGFIVQMDQTQDRDQATKFTGCNIAVLPQVLPGLPPGEYYFRDLTGLMVVTTQGVRLGEVRECLNTGANSVLVVQNANTPKGQEHLIPWLPAQGVIVEVQMEDGQILVNWDPDFQATS